MVTVIFETHATTTDNEQRIASGHSDVDLSATGVAQAGELGERYRTAVLDAVYCSDLRRSYRTAEIAFPERLALIRRDRRLRECDYGEWTRRPVEEIELERVRRIAVPFPGGESYADCVRRMSEFLEALRRSEDAGTVLLIGHRATQYALEVLLNGKPLEEVVSEHWQWQPGWRYGIP
jgi:broad specificity phosphatase PhoE